MATQLAPTSDNMIVKAEVQEETTQSGIYGSHADEKPQVGVVSAVGPGKMSDNGTLIPMSFSIGDRVLFQKYAPTEVKIDGEKILVIQESDVIAKVL